MKPKNGKTSFLTFKVFVKGIEKLDSVANISMSNESNDRKCAQMTKISAIWSHCRPKSHVWNARAINVPIHGLQFWFSAVEITGKINQTCTNIEHDAAPMPECTGFLRGWVLIPVKGWWSLRCPRCTGYLFGVQIGYWRATQRCSLKPVWLMKWRRGLEWRINGWNEGWNILAGVVEWSLHSLKTLRFKDLNSVGVSCWYFYDAGHRLWTKSAFIFCLRGQKVL